MDKQAKQDQMHNIVASLSFVVVIILLVIGITSPELQAPATASAVIAGSAGAVSAVMAIFH